ncbi:MAG: beta-ketoacyl reductase, partial [Terriglobia bacterium]
AISSDHLSIDSLEEALLLTCGSVLHLIQALKEIASVPPPRLCLVTRGGVPLGQRSNPIEIAQAPIWGLSRVIALEHPELHCVTLDLDPLGDKSELLGVVDEIWMKGREDQIAIRQGQRFVARLRKKILDSRYQKNSLSKPSIDTSPFREKGTYLITGGLGSLGLIVAEWMIEKGARHLVLMGRRGVSPTMQDRLQKMEERGAKVMVVQGDVSQSQDVQRLLSEVAHSMPPLRGIIHGAGVLDDGVLLQQNWNRFLKVMAPKVKGAWNLHELTRGLTLDFFVLFSSGASLIGSGGQGNYAAANAFLDSTAHYRQAKGLPGLSINWGPWAGVGLAAAVRDQAKNRWSDLGLTSILPEQGVQVLEQVLRSGCSQIGVLPIQWARFFERFATGQEPPLFTELARETRIQSVTPKELAKSDLLKELHDALPSDRWDILVTYLHDLAVKILGFDKSRTLDVHQGFFDIGMDSLTALELKNDLQQTLGQTLPSSVVFDHPNILDLAEYVAGEISSLKATKLSRAAQPPASRELVEVPNRREELTEEELTVLLAERLRQIE